jgi:hypothetical protein
MKYISVIIVLLLMAWTWSLATSEPAFGLQQYKQVELGVEQDVRAFIQKKYPQTTEIFCQQLYSEVVTPGSEMIAHFRCQAAGPAVAGADSTEQVFEGYLNLKSDNGFETWSETGGQIRSPEIRFLNGVKVTPRSNEPAEPLAEPAAPATGAAPSPAPEAAP